MADSDAEEVVVEADPTGRFKRFAVSLGKGAFKEVFKAFDQEEGVEVAWNQMRLDTFTQRDVQRILSEIQILESVRSENIINLFYSWVVRAKDGVTIEKIIFITELMTSGTLKNYLRKANGSVNRKSLIRWSRQILLGLEYLHCRDPPIIHRDLKCQNIFINGNSGQAKIGDLGLAAVKSRQHMSSVLGTPEFMAPELYDELYDEKVDIYAFGMVIIEIDTLDYPYSECQNQAQIFKKVSSGIKPLALNKITDQDTREFVELCIRFDPKTRPTATELLKHPFLNPPLQAPKQQQHHHHQHPQQQLGVGESHPQKPPPPRLSSPSSIAAPFAATATTTSAAQSISTYSGASSSSASLFDDERNAVEMLKKLSTTDTVVSGSSNQASPSQSKVLKQSMTTLKSVTATDTLSPVLSIAAEGMITLPPLDLSPSIVPTDSVGFRNRSDSTQPQSLLQQAPRSVTGDSDFLQTAPVQQQQQHQYQNQQQQHLLQPNTFSPSDGRMLSSSPDALRGGDDETVDVHGRYVMRPLERLPSDSSVNERASVTGAPSASQAASRVQVEVVGRSGDNDPIVNLRLVYRGREKINFPFNLKEDTATDVISEMTSESLLDEGDQSVARRKLEETLREYYMTMASAPSSAASLDEVEQTGSVTDGLDRLGLPLIQTTAMSPAESDVFHDALESAVQSAVTGTSSEPLSESLPKYSSLPRSRTSSMSLGAELSLSRKNSVPNAVFRTSPPPPLSFHHPKSPTMIRASPQRRYTASGRTSTASKKAQQHQQQPSQSMEDIMSSTSSTSSRPATPLAFAVDQITGKIVPIGDIEPGASANLQYHQLPANYQLYVQQQQQQQRQQQEQLQQQQHQQQQQQQLGNSSSIPPSGLLVNDPPTVGVNYFPGMSMSSNASSNASSASDSSLQQPGGYHAYNAQGEYVEYVRRAPPQQQQQSPPPGPSSTQSSRQPSASSLGVLMQDSSFTGDAPAAGEAASPADSVVTAIRVPQPTSPSQIPPALAEDDDIIREG
ncbi:MAG: hypothetical protein SGCHY_000812 [Lobulomycetales sp.]